MFRTIESYQGLFEQLSRLGFDNFIGKRVNQDCLENYFGLARSMGDQNTSPTCEQFDGVFRTLLINNVTNVQLLGSNYSKEEQVEPYLELENLLNQSLLEQVHIASELDAQDYERNFLQEQLTRGLSPNSVAKLSIKASKNTKVCQACWQSVNSSQFNKAVEKLVASMMTEMSKQFKKLNLKKISFQYATRTFDKEWNTCEEHAHELLKNTLNCAIDQFLYAWCRTQNAAIHKSLLTRKRPAESSLKKEKNKSAKLSKIMQTKGKRNKNKKTNNYVSRV